MRDKELISDQLGREWHCCEKRFDQTFLSLCERFTYVTTYNVTSYVTTHVTMYVTTHVTTHVTMYMTTYVTSYVTM